MTDEIRSAVLRSASHSEIRAIARRNGMKTLEEGAKHKVRSGITTVEEIHRVLTSFA